MSTDIQISIERNCAGNVWVLVKNVIIRQKDISLDVIAV